MSELVVICPTKQDQYYRTINLTAMLDSNLSWKAKGLLYYFHTRPKKWKLWINDLKQKSTDGEASIRAGITELIKTKYLHRGKVYKHGKILWGISFVFSEPTKFNVKKAIKNLNLENLNEENLNLENKVHSYNIHSNKKKISKKDNKANFSFLELFPKEWQQSKPFQKTWSDWKIHREEIKKPLTRMSVVKQINVFKEYSIETSIEILDNIIKEGWRGLIIPEGKFKKIGDNSKPLPPHLSEETDLDYKQRTNTMTPEDEQARIEHGRSIYGDERVKD